MRLAVDSLDAGGTCNDFDCEKNDKCIIIYQWRLVGPENWGAT